MNRQLKIVRLSVGEVAAALNAGTSSVQRWADGGEFGPVAWTAGGHRRIAAKGAAAHARRRGWHEAAAKLDNLANGTAGRRLAIHAVVDAAGADKLAGLEKCVEEAAATKRKRAKR